MAMIRTILSDLGIPETESGVRLILMISGLIACIAITVFVLGTTAFGKYPAQAQYGTILILGMIAVFALKPGPLARDGKVTNTDLLLSLVFIGMALWSSIYFLNNYFEIADLREGIPNTQDIVYYSLGTLCVLEAARRVEGWMLLSVVIVAIIYLFFGHYMPGILEHRPFSPSQVLEISYSYQGIYGVALAAVSDVVLVFVILGVALRISGAGDFFNYIAMKFTQGRRSGPAQCAIIASSLFGSVNGSAPANVSATGVLTIPMMKRAGYKAPFAGAVEATSSCVGQILPPIMGVGAFIMSEITGIPYTDIMLAALIPAFLFILSLSCAVAFEAGRTGLEPIDFGRVDWTSERVAQGVTLLAGFGTLITMLIVGYAPTFCGLVATGTVLVLANAFPSTRLDTSKVVQFFVDGGRDGLAVLASCAAIGIVIGAVTTTGLGIKLNQVIVALGNEQLFLALILAALCSIVPGMGLPTAASYIKVIFVAGPAIMELGVGLLQTHLFVFYYAVLSAITPPVALAVFAAAAIAQTPPIPLALNAIRLCFVGFVLPMAWVYHPEINLENLSLESVPLILTQVIALIIAVVAVTASHIGYFVSKVSLIERLILLIGGALVLYPDPIIEAGGTISAAIILGLSYFRASRLKHQIN
jgi:TRAP transporter 4TM/12TM fusion protein